MPNSVGFARFAKNASTASWRSTREAIGKLRAAVARRSSGYPEKWRARRLRVADKPLTIRNICPIMSPPGHLTAPVHCGNYTAHMLSLALLLLVLILLLGFTPRARVARAEVRV